MDGTTAPAPPTVPWRPVIIQVDFQNLLCSFLCPSPFALVSLQIYIKQCAVGNDKFFSFISNKANLIWVLQGKLYSFPKINHFVSKAGSTLTNNNILDECELFVSYLQYYIINNNI